MRPLRFGLLLVLLFALASPALAHRINIFALDEGGEVYTESTFAGKRPVKGGTIRVRDAEGTLLYTGKTDDKGICTFPRPAAGELTVEVDAGMGHKNRWELDAAAGAATPDTRAAVAADLGVSAPGVPSPQAASVPGFSASDWGRMEQVVDAAVAKALHQAREETRLRDVVGGIGYIVGLLGIVAWGRSRREPS